MATYYHLNSLDLPLFLESIGSSWTQGTKKRPNGYPFYHWLQTDKGCGRFLIGDNEFRLPPGAGILTAPNVPQFYFSEKGGWLTSFATFDGPLIPAVAQSIGGKDYYYVPPVDGSYFRSWINRHIVQYEKHQLESTQLAVDCFDFFMRFTESHRQEQHLSHPLYRQYVEPAIQEIETNFHQPITVASLAASLYISPQYLTRLFNRFTGNSVYTYLTNYRINAAKELLVNQDQMEIQQLATQVGFQDSSHFISVFKKSTGITPMEFRKSH